MKINVEDRDGWFLISFDGMLSTSHCMVALTAEDAMELRDQLVNFLGVRVYYDASSSRNKNTP